MAEKVTFDIEVDGARATVRELDKIDRAIEDVDRTLGELDREADTAARSMRDFSSDGARSTSRFASDVDRDTARAGRSLRSLGGDADRAVDDIERSFNGLDVADIGGQLGDGLSGLFGTGGLIATGIAGAITAGLSAFGVDQLLGDAASVLSEPLSFEGDIASASARIGIPEGALLPIVERIEEARGIQDRSTIAAAIVAAAENADTDNVAALGNLVDNVLGISLTGVGSSQEVANAIGELSQQFDVDFATAADLLSASVRDGGDRTGQLIDTITEYAQSASQVGLTAPEFVAGLTTAAGPQFGQLGQDKLADAIKELDIKVFDGSADEALEAIGLSPAQLRQDLAAGGTRARQALDEILAGIEGLNAAEQRRAIADLFGSPGEDFGGELIDVLAGGLEQLDYDRVANELVNQASDVTSFRGVVREQRNDVFGVNAPSVLESIGSFLSGGLLREGFGGRDRVANPVNISVSNIPPPQFTVTGVVSSLTDVRRFANTYADEFAVALGPAIVREVNQQVQRARVFGGSGRQYGGV